VLDQLVAEGRGLPSQFSYRNFGRISEHGIELSVAARISDAVTTFANFTWQSTPEAHGFNQAELNLPPAHHANAGVRFTRGRYFATTSASYQDAAFWQDVTRFEGGPGRSRPSAPPRASRPPRASPSCSVRPTC
jgi:outer membrane receptor for ferrienterochelin and colicin